MHVEIPVKVNAWVDEGVAPLVEALNGFDRVMTLDSCQGGEERPAYVYFKCQGPGVETALFVVCLAEALSTNTPPCEYILRVEWLAGSDEVMAELRTSPQFVYRLASSLTQVASAFRASPSASRRAFASMNGDGLSFVPTWVPKPACQ